MLKKLDSIDWGSLTHAYGSAEDVPCLLRAIAFGEPSPGGHWADDVDDVYDPMEPLGSAINQQGTIYDSTEYVLHDQSEYNKGTRQVPVLSETTRCPGGMPQVLHR